ncbi:MAG: NUDIX domain-containing protein [Devosia sp.]|nr:NUDIX domain-containing protein [Devosia sp.]
MNNRTLLTFDVGPNRFNYRVAAVIVRDGHVLTCREDDDDWLMLPGGRVEMGEPSQVALGREIAEELRSPGEIGPLLFMVENFFAREDRSFHEIGVYYRVTLPESFPFAPGGVVLEVEDEGHRLQFEWLPVEEEALYRRNLLPRWIVEKLRVLPDSAQHLVMHELPA